ncbi:hypothetical protein AB0K02_33240 [Streptomyces sp. NPDC049597]|uniref:hypothetical protein n=1 Tax=Streptomyces sp. NPDC049597 TaxID=3155276 RepID=UPI003443951E
MRQLLDAPSDDPVLYVSHESEEPQLDVWAAAYVPHDDTVVHRWELLDALGDAPDEDIWDHLALLQETVEEIVGH